MASEHVIGIPTRVRFARVSRKDVNFASISDRRCVVLLQSALEARVSLPLVAHPQALSPEARLVFGPPCQQELPEQRNESEDWSQEEMKAGLFAPIIALQNVAHSTLE